VYRSTVLLPLIVLILSPSVSATDPGAILVVPILGGVCILLGITLFFAIKIGYSVYKGKTLSALQNQLIILFILLFLSSYILSNLDIRYILSSLF